MKGDPRGLGFSTRAIHAGQPPEPRTGAVATPIFQTSTYIQKAFGDSDGWEYARGQNPTRNALEENVAALESGLAGHAFASGMAAINALISMAGTGERVVVSQDVYGGTHRLFTQVLDRYGIDFTWVDTSDLANLEAAMTDNTRLVFIETPTNPLLEVTDLAGAAEIAHRYGALLAVDNTFLSPYLQRPLEHGADIVVHSATKFLNGHSDCLGGVVVTSRKEEADWFRFVQKSAGAILGPQDCFLILRGIKTLAVRMDRHLENTARMVDMLEGHPLVSRLLYPGLAEHPGYEVQQRQASGGGAILSFDLGSLDAARRLLNSVRVMSLGESLGGVETLISHPASMTHAAIPAEQREAAGVTDGLVRVSVGIEDVDDLLSDLDQALQKVAAGRSTRAGSRAAAC